MMMKRKPVFTWTSCIYCIFIWRNTFTLIYILLQNHKTPSEDVVMYQTYMSVHWYVCCWYFTTALHVCTQQIQGRWPFAWTSHVIMVWFLPQSVFSSRSLLLLHCILEYLSYESACLAGQQERQKHCINLQFKSKLHDVNNKHGGFIIFFCDSQRNIRSYVSLLMKYISSCVFFNNNI